MSDIRQAYCKVKAKELLQSFWVGQPAEIDLIALAHRAGRLRIEDGGLEHSEGRIVAGANGGTIRVKAGLNPARRSFTIAHEIGHYVLHPRTGLERDDTAKNFSLWNDAGEESEANKFAAELLMPEFLFAPRTIGGAPSLAFVDRLSREFSTSMMAAAYQYVAYTVEQVALIVTVGGVIKSSARSRDFWPSLRMGKVHPDSAAGEIFSGKSGDTKGMVNSPAYAWLPRFANDFERDIKEDSRYIDWYDCVITLLWLDDDLSD